MDILGSEEMLSYQGATNKKIKIWAAVGVATCLLVGGGVIGGNPIVLVVIMLMVYGF